MEGSWLAFAGATTLTFPDENYAVGSPDEEWTVVLDAVEEPVGGPSIRRTFRFLEPPTHSGSVSNEDAELRAVGGRGRRAGRRSQTSWWASSARCSA